MKIKPHQLKLKIKTELFLFIFHIQYTPTDTDTDWFEARTQSKLVRDLALHPM